jgi:hypothetical protein
MNIRATVGDGPLNKIDIGRVVLHKEYVFHCGSPSSYSLRVHATGKGAWTEGLWDGTGSLFINWSK